MLVRLLLLFIVQYCLQAAPNYWPGRTYTAFNGTQHAPVPFTIESKLTEYNEKNTPRDNLLKNRLLSYTPIDLWDKTNYSPENKTGTVRFNIIIKNLENNEAKHRKLL